MIFNTLALLTLALGLLVSLVSGNPSAVPYNGYTCPALDKGNFAIGVTNYATNPISCAYPLTAGSTDTTFNCEYSTTTGALINDNDDDGCPETAVVPVQRRSSRVARAPLPSRPLVNRGVPAGLADKAYLKKRRS
ncbi:hypothetical protein HYPSUDRAFT_70171 [Hypholoma sublateritium FD-334 SS-4]|uniref:Uncharacterized protein n=1 Tax=Hypholoma sublateritium (strain FD-334 SS-4) TaxID=945553 RepID=A0A0D2KU74_HYPSF|nr:hypothetical protein HYPSUDRAFT_70171 [Hypholoma sublateritium FD-334 SS-4]